MLEPRRLLARLPFSSSRVKAFGGGSDSLAPAAREAARMEGIHAVCKVNATFFEHYAACQPFVALSQQKKERSNDFQPKFAVLCEFLSVLVLQVGVIQDNVGFVESLLCLRFV